LTEYLLEAEFPNSLCSTMISATRRWFRRNRKTLAIGTGVIGVGYLAGQYVISKISEARERMSSDRIAREK
jgi:peroxin-3